MDFSKEVERNYLFPEGWQKVVITSYKIKKTSITEENGVLVTLAHTSSNVKNDFWLSMVEGKRFMLKKLLEATEAYKTDIDANYVFDMDDLIGRMVMAKFTIGDYIYGYKGSKNYIRKGSEITDFKKAEPEEDEDIPIPF
jgi:hypothetical protein